MINEESIVCKKSLNTILYTESEKKIKYKRLQTYNSFLQ